MISKLMFKDLNYLEIHQYILELQNSMMRKLAGCQRRSLLKTTLKTFSNSESIIYSKTFRSVQTTRTQKLETAPSHRKNIFNVQQKSVSRHIKRKKSTHKLLSNPLVQKKLQNRSNSCHNIQIMTPRTSAYLKYSAKIKDNIYKRIQPDNILQTKIKQSYLDQLQKQKNKILQQLKQRQSKDKHNVSTPLVDCQTENLKIQLDNMIVNIIPQLDKVCIIFNSISTIMIQYKIHFRTSMFLLYKLYRQRRVFEYFKVLQISKTLAFGDSKIQQIQDHNKQITNCVQQMLKKLKQSKKWKQINEKQIFQIFNCNDNELRTLIRLTLKKTIKDINELYLYMVNNNQYKNKLKLFGSSIIFLLYEWASSQLKPQIQNLSKRQSCQSMSMQQIKRGLILLMNDFQNDYLR